MTTTLPTGNSAKMVLLMEEMKELRSIQMHCTAAIVCGGSLVKPGTASKTVGGVGKTILEEIVPWLEVGGMDLLGQEAAG